MRTPKKPMQSPPEPKIKGKPKTKGRPSLPAEKPKNVSSAAWEVMKKRDLEGK